nr:ribonuclease H-like domain-containing protein [Tanacetum cinerariifolium]
MYRVSDLDSIKNLTNEVETLKEEKDVVDGKLARLLKSSNDLENIIESQRSDKVKEGVGYNAVPPPKKREATAVKIALLLKSRRNCQSKSNDSYAKDSYEVPASAASTATTDTASDGTGKKKGMTVTMTTEDMQKRKTDVKARTTLLLSLPDEHQLRFSKYKTTQELWDAILKTFGGNEATKKTKKNLLKQYLAPEWLMHTIVWRNMSDLDTMSLDDLYNHLKVYESEVQKKSEPNPQNIAFISSAKHSRGNEDVNTASVSTASTSVPTASANIGCRAPKSQDRGRRGNYRQGSKVEEQAPKALMAIDEVGWDWSYMANDEENHALVADKEAPIEFALMANTSAESKDMFWTGLSEFKDDTVTDYSRPAPTVESSPNDAQNRNPFVNEEASPSTISPKSFIKFVKANDSPTTSKTDKAKTAKKPPVKSKLCDEEKCMIKCGDFNHLAYDCRKRVKKGTSRSQNNTHKSFTPRPAAHKPYRPPMRPMRSNMNVRSHYRAPWVPTVNRNFPPVDRKFSTGSRNFPTANRKFPTASRKFPAGSTKCSTADME